MISNDTYTKAIQDVLEFIDRVEDGDLDFINGDGYDKDIYYIAHKLDMFIRNPEKYKF